jgi:hypothetical protein
VSTTGRQTNPTSSSCAPPVDSQRTGFSGNGQFVGNLALLKRTRGRKNCEIGLLTSAREPVLSLSQTWHGRLVNGNPIPACPRGILRGGGCTALIGRSMFWALKMARQASPFGHIRVRWLRARSTSPPRCPDVLRKDGRRRGQKGISRRFIPRPGCACRVS